MKTRRTFLKEISLVFTGLAITSSKIFSQNLPQIIKEQTTMPYELSPLPYSYDALEPFIDAQTMEIHYSKHHAAYVNNLNTALANYPDIQKKTPIELITFLNSIPEAVRTAVRNNAGGHVNHTMFWQQLKKGVAEPKGKLGEAITATFGSMEAMKEQFTKAGLGRFGSGWSWLAVDANKKLFITSTPNQDNPLMDGNIPILGCDVWEHAYYLKYQNKRADYLAAFWKVINWNDVAERYSTAVK